MPFFSHYLNLVENLKNAIKIIIVKFLVQAKRMKNRIITIVT